MVIAIEKLTSDELDARRREIIRALGHDEDDIRRRASEYTLNLAEDALFRELDGIDFLLGR